MVSCDKKNPLSDSSVNRGLRFFDMVTISNVLFMTTNRSLFDLLHSTMNTHND